MTHFLVALESEKGNEILEKVKQDRHISFNIGMELGIDHKTVLNHLQKTCYKNKLNIWVPCELSVKNLIERINICNAVLKRNEIKHYVITGNEKQTLYNNRKLKRSWI